MIGLVTAPPNTEKVGGFAGRVSAFGAVYGYRTDFCRYYEDETGSIRLFWQEGLARISLSPGADVEAAEALLAQIANEIVSDTPLHLPGFTVKSGLRFVGKPPAATLTGVEERLSAAYLLLREGFPTLSPTRYREWYTDLSHRIRHGMTRVFVLPGRATVTADLVPGGAFLSQITTATLARGQGYASRLIGYGAKVLGVKTLWVDSQTPTSDNFYRAMGFSEEGRWYSYTRKEQED